VSRAGDEEAVEAVVPCCVRRSSKRPEQHAARLRIRCKYRRGEKNEKMKNKKKIY